MIQGQFTSTTRAKQVFRSVVIVADVHTLLLPLKRFFFLPSESEANCRVWVLTEYLLCTNMWRSVSL